MNIRAIAFACCALLTAGLLAYFGERRPEPTIRPSKPPGLSLSPPMRHGGEYLGDPGAPMKCGRCICYVGDNPPNLNEGC
jgi:hypothetical protein